MTPTVSIVIVNWNGRELLETCLPAVLAQTYRDYEVVLVDNGSSDGSAAWVTERFPSIRLVSNERNTGFCAGNNQAFAASQAPYLAILNNDAAPEPGWLAAMVEALDSSPDVGMIAPKVLQWRDHMLLDSAGIAPDRTGTVWQLGAARRDPGQAEPTCEVFGPGGAAALYRRTMLDDVGSFDEDFFAYLEDADLAWRAQLAGWRCLYVPAARVYHRHSATSGRSSPFKAYHLGRNKWWTIVKNYPSPQVWWNLPLIVGRELLATLYYLLSGNRAALRGRLDALRGLRRMLDKRRVVQRRATVEGRARAWRLRRPLR